MSPPPGGQENQCNSRLWQAFGAEAQPASLPFQSGGKLAVFDDPPAVEFVQRIHVGDIGRRGCVVGNERVVRIDEPLEGSGPEVFAEDAFRLNLPTVEKRSLIAYRHRHLVERKTLMCKPNFFLWGGHYESALT